MCNWVSGCVLRMILAAIALGVCAGVRAVRGVEQRTVFNCVRRVHRIQEVTVLKYVQQTARNVEATTKPSFLVSKKCSMIHQNAYSTCAQFVCRKVAASLSSSTASPFPQYSRWRTASPLVHSLDSYSYPKQPSPQHKNSPKRANGPRALADPAVSVPGRPQRCQGQGRAHQTGRQVHPQRDAHQKASHSTNCRALCNDKAVNTRKRLLIAVRLTCGDALAVRPGCAVKTRRLEFRTSSRRRGCSRTRGLPFLTTEARTFWGTWRRRTTSLSR